MMAMLYNVKEFPLFSSLSLSSCRMWILFIMSSAISFIFLYIYLCNTPSSIIVVKFISSPYNSLPFCTFLSHLHHIFSCILRQNGNHHLHERESHESWLICIEIENYKFRFHFYFVNIIIPRQGIYIFMFVPFFCLSSCLLLLHVNYSLTEVKERSQAWFSGEFIDVSCASEFNGILMKILAKFFWFW